MPTDNLAGLLKTLADPTRMRILTELAEGNLCVGALAYRLGVSHSVISQHLRIMREAGFVEGERQGYRVHYALNRPRIHEVSAQVGKWLEGLSSVSAGECMDNKRKYPGKGESRSGKSAARR